ncbi:MAG: UDP-glucose/GDP-mannose dehydrogenase family protein [Nanoarchaeales archaeon]|nr:UDP-glucose/GDP-mannose dehydrogenase family protein [Nanoarchaeales archaeon]
MVKITIVGTGYVGLVTGTCLAEVGHEVICSDICEDKINILKNGECPIYEPGLLELITKNVKSKRLTFTTDVPSAIKESDVIFSAVGTPMGENYEADLKYVKAVAQTFAENLNGYKVFVNKSTVPVGTGDIVKETIMKTLNNSVINYTESDFDIISNPEFLKEGAAVKDFLNPDRIVIGSETKKAEELMKKVYGPFVRVQSPIVFMDIKSAELTKYAANSMLAVRISFMNEIAAYCDKVGANVKEVAKGIGLDTRIGPKFLNAGIGYGGSCFPKDVAAIVESGKQVGHDFKIIKSAMDVNDIQRTIAVDKITNILGEDLTGKTITLLGLAFKPRTDDVREAPAIYKIRELLNKGAIVNVFDTIAEKNFKLDNPEFNINYFDNHYDALENSDCLLLVTEWDEFRTIDFAKVKQLMKGNLIVDGRNIYNPKEVKDLGFEYAGIGRQ